MIPRASVVVTEFSGEDLELHRPVCTQCEPMLSGRAYGTVWKGWAPKVLGKRVHEELDLKQTEYVLGRNLFCWTKIHCFIQPVELSSGEQGIDNSPLMPSCMRVDFLPPWFLSILPNIPGPLPSVHILTLVTV